MDKFPEYNTLSGLRAENLVNKNTKRKIQMEGCVEDYIQNGDEIECDIVFDERWLFVKYYFQGPGAMKEIDIEVKIGKGIFIRHLLFIVEKMAMNLWSSIYIKNQSHYYVLKDITASIVISDTNQIKDISVESVGQIIDETLKSQKVDAHFPPNSVLLVVVDIITLEDQLMRNPRYFFEKFGQSNDIDPVPKSVDSKVPRKEFGSAVSFDYNNPPDRNLSILMIYYSKYTIQWLFWSLCYWM